MFGELSKKRVSAKKMTWWMDWVTSANSGSRGLADRTPPVNYASPQFDVSRKCRVNIQSLPTVLGGVELVPEDLVTEVDITETRLHSGSLCESAPKQASRAPCSRKPAISERCLQTMGLGLQHA